MIKKLLFITTIFAAGFTSAQSFQIMDHNDVDITGTTHTETGTGLVLAETKFHVKNLTGAQKTYGSRVQRIANTTTSNLQVCFGVNCYIAYDNNSAVQIIPGNGLVSANGIDSTYKVAPFSFSWGAGESTTWRVTVFDIANPNDSATAIMVWNSTAASVDEFNKDDVALSIYPNPASANLTINYAINGNANKSSLAVFDIVGQKVKSYNLSNQKGQLNLDVSDLKAGVYFYTINVDGITIKTERVIIK